MGRSKARQPKRLAEKLRKVRLSRKLTQDEIAMALRTEGSKVYRGYVALYESGERIPSLLVLLAYARFSGVTMEELVDDELDL